MKLIVGCGYLGAEVGRRWLAAGQTVAAIVPRAGQAEQLARQGFQSIVADVTRPETLAQLPAAETVLYAVGYDPLAGHSRREVYVGGLQNVLALLPPGAGRVIFISSTGVYGETGGDWVDEDSPSRPAGDAGRTLLAAEEVLRRHALGPRGIILRLAGLYGRGRLPRLAGLSGGDPLSIPADDLVNLIHVEDAAGVVLAAEQFARPPRTYVVSDGHPVERRTYLSRLAEVSGLPPLRFCQPVEDARGVAPRRRRGGNKRVNNARMLAELGIQLAYPSYREGLAASMG
jgi:nucleoside-diphosphate-sugar epimerase